MPKTFFKNSPVFGYLQVFMGQRYGRTNCELSIFAELSLHDSVDAWREDWHDLAGHLQV